MHAMQHLLAALTRTMRTQGASASCNTHLCYCTERWHDPFQLLSSGHTFANSAQRPGKDQQASAGVLTHQTTYCTTNTQATRMRTAPINCCSSTFGFGVGAGVATIKNECTDLCQLNKFVSNLVWFMYLRSVEQPKRQEASLSFVYIKVRVLPETSK